MANPQWNVSRATFFLIASTVVLLDQLSKLAAIAALKGAEPVVLIPGCLRLIYQTNTGAAFSMLQGHVAKLAMLSIAIGIGLALWGMWLKPGEQGLRIQLGLILGGAVGNLIDRLRLGEVVDMIDAHWKNVYHYPTFNLADSAVCVGMVLLILASFLPVESAEPEPAAGGRASKGEKRLESGEDGISSAPPKVR